MTAHGIGVALIIGGFAYLLAISIWTGGLIPFSRREAARRGESFDRTRAKSLGGVPLLASIVAVLAGLWLRSAG